MGSKVKLGELLSILTDYHANGAYKKLKENVELLDEPDFAVMIRTTNFEQEDFTNNLKYINKHAYSFLAKSKVYPNDIIMNKIANAGSSYLMPDLKVPVSLAMNLFLLRVDAAKANPIYIYLYLRVNEAYVKSFANGSVTKTITKDAVRNLEIELPSRSIQDRIAEQFICINNKITLNRQINKTLEQMAQTLFKSWFVDFDPVVDNALDAGFFEQDLGFSEELLHRVEVRKTVRKSDNFKPLSEDIRQLFPASFEECAEPALGLGGWVPKGWEILILSKLSKIASGKRPPTKGTVKTEEEPIPVWGGNGIKWFTDKPLSTDKYIITGRVGTLGTVYKVDGPSWASDNALVIKPLQHEYFEFIYQTLCNFDIHSLNSGSTQPLVTQTALSGIQLIFPRSTKLLLEYQKSIDIYDEKFKVNSNEVESLTQLRDTLLPKLISGELSLNELKIDNPEETLI
ncbi:restriction endonuclease subunit S [Proteus mirabilis]|uniref:restriction endonuclease subunit S n=1 Tax=Proteus mirabilis TaxID=584 RepID=UPI00069FD60F|nr:restriction endonuclease subunit S [Proteus mirabilis]EKW1741449.1 restriction endonuclease subunit S [Proteus mirabilis]MBI6306526.1 restriction endonuclease subunit S [Proteus mirabilis]MDC9731409.1 restriction endonuclease subunit S [Proteus mirabilis]MDF7438564.1 restriction endonuclease subunit S [Proteus mirabilis]QHZ89841.1 restriction endonuclease subunit S [Proteus mirabilis]